MSRFSGASQGSFKVKYIRGAVESGQLRFGYLLFCVCPEPPWIDIVFVIHNWGCSHLLHIPPSQGRV